ncbi:D-octopine dehydrogenase [Clostridiaceae bacterium JG1575]|nr:D-octopine dehydrogenase [Clostridiaceae bacterium JG1575]
MKIAVVGAGNGGCAVAADLSLKGHEVTLLKTSHSMHNANFEHLEKKQGEITLWEGDEKKTTHIHRVTREVEELEGNEVVILYVQTNHHEAVLRKILPHIHEDQILLINPGYLSTAYVLKHTSKNLTVVEATSSFIDCRIQEPGLIKVGFRNVRNPLGVFPRERQEYVAEKLEALGVPFAYFSSVVEAALHNPNMIVHTVGAVMSIPRIENTKGDYCMYHEVFTPSVWNILEKLDEEKMDIIEHLGYERISYVEACKFRNTLDDTKNAKEIFFWYAAMPTRAKGPLSVDSRYLSEDVPQGLVMLEALGKALGIATPMSTSLIELASAALGRNLRSEGRTPERLGSENIQRILEDSQRG